MKDKASQMKAEIRAVADYRALMISNYYIITALIVISLYLGYKKYNMSSLYILIVNFVLPNAISVGIKDYAVKTGKRIFTDIVKEAPAQLSMLQKKYHYTRLKYISYSISYLVTLLFIGLWQYSYTLESHRLDNIQELPFYLLLSGLSLRLLFLLFYRIKLPYDLFRNRS